MSAQTPNIEFELRHGQSAKIPGHAKTTVENPSDQEGKLFYRLNPPPVTDGTILVPPHGSKNVPLGPTGGVIKNEGEVPLFIVCMIG